MRAHSSPNPYRTHLYTQNLCIPKTYDQFVQPRHLGETFDHFVGFMNVGNPQPVAAARSVSLGPTSLRLFLTVTNYALTRG